MYRPLVTVNEHGASTNAKMNTQGIHLARFWTNDEPRAALKFSETDFRGARCVPVVQFKSLWFGPAMWGCVQELKHCITEPLDVTCPI